MSKKNRHQSKSGNGHVSYKRHAVAKRQNQTAQVCKSAKSGTVVDQFPGPNGATTCDSAVVPDVIAVSAAPVTLPASPSLLAPVASTVVSLLQVPAVSPQRSAIGNGDLIVLKPAANRNCAVGATSSNVRIPAALLPNREDIPGMVRIDGRMVNRNMTFEKFSMWDDCHLRFNRFMSGKVQSQPDTAEEHLSRTIGKAIELAVSVDDQSTREKIVQTQLATLPVAERTEALKKIEKAVVVADEFYGDQNSLRQPQWSYLDTTTGWVLRAKPDEVQFEELKDGTWVVRVIDDKHTWRVTRRHERQLRFFGLVVTMVIEKQLAEWMRNGGKRIKYRLELVVRLLGERSDDTVDAELGNLVSQGREFPVHTSYGALRFRLLSDVQRACAGIDAAYKEQNFPGKYGRACSFCKVAEGCPVLLAQEALTGVVAEQTLVRIA